MVPPRPALTELEERIREAGLDVEAKAVAGIILDIARDKLPPLQSVMASWIEQLALDVLQSDPRSART